VTIRDLTSIPEFRQIVELERTIWGYTDAADLCTVPVFIFTVKRGAILIAAVDDADRMVGFAYSVVGMKDGRPMQWSHMTGVLPDHRGGLGYRLKLEQRQRAIARGFDLIEWTFDPMQAMNAHFNLFKLGAVIEEYAENFYGESTSALHRGTPTDRIIAHWRIREPHVVRRIEAPSAFRVRAHEVEEAPIVNTSRQVGAWREPQSSDLQLDARRVRIEIPTGFTDILRESHELALHWRLHLRELFQAYLSRGYRAVDFTLEREKGFGRYLLASTDS
jgi:predicted GNAT superfamily acetyltransferase